MKQVVTTEQKPIKLWLDDIEEGALQQARNLANLPFTFKWVAIMPDSHQGYGMPIGGVLATTGVVIPNAVGVDIGCGMCAVKTSLLSIERDSLKLIMGKIRERVPLGFNHHKEKQGWEGFDHAPDVAIIQQELNASRYQLGTEHHFEHNVIVHRKGATSAKEGQLGIIPGSQGTKSYIVRGKGNPESFMSCSHGAGRKMGRKQAQRELNLEEEKKRLDDQGIIHAIRTEKDLDEASGAYKDIGVVMDNQSDLVDIVVELSPLAVIKS